MTTFKSFLDSLIVENLHPELQRIVQAHSPRGANKKPLLVNKIKELSKRGESTGIEGNMPSGSSRAYMKHLEDHPILLDGKPTKIKTGIKVAIRAHLDKYHAKHDHDDLSLGGMQNRAEGGDYFINKHYRILEHDGHGNYESNKDMGIFPPLVDHDYDHHEWSHVGHVENITEKRFRIETRTDSHPSGIHFHDFRMALIRDHEKNHGKYWPYDEETEKERDHITSHPLVQKFIDYHHHMTGYAPNDYHIKNMGLWHHPDGSKHILCRDHGYDNETSKAYSNAIRRKFNTHTR